MFDTTESADDVGYSSEAVEWVTRFYDASRYPGQEGDPEIKQQHVKIASARAVLRYSMLDTQSNRAMRIETIAGWRDVHGRSDADGGPICTRSA
jgi:hypothetical protein